MASTGEVWKLGHRPALDGVRGIAVLLVVASHAFGARLAGAGVMGVTAFFTLSGFLITALLLEERADTGAIRLRAFYRRRVLRLIPALVAFLAVMLVAGAALPKFAEPVDVAAALLYVGNWVMASEAGHLGGLAHTWSLSVEEQFYMLWPLVVIACLRWWSLRVLTLVAAFVALASVALRLLLWDGGQGVSRVYFGTDTRADALLVGCLLALWMHQQRSDNHARSGPLVGVGAGACALLTLTGATAGFMVFPTLVPVLTAAAVWAVTQGAYRGLLEARWLVAVGRRSYALYLWHYPLMVAGPMFLPGPRWASVPLLLAASWGVTVLSWRFVESPFLRARTRSYAPSSHESIICPMP